MDLFRVRLNCIDHYQATPTRYDPQLRNDVRVSQVKRGPKVPVVRVFGSTETGQKVCAHIHGAFPYLYVEYQGGLDQDEVGAFIYRLHLSIDHALSVSYRKDQYGGNAKYVARITLVKGTPFYGFHVGYKYFLKIYMYNPIVMTRLSDLLQQGVVMKRVFQPYEAHLQYLLQFMTDYNLYGCDYLDASSVCFRSPVPSLAEEGADLHHWHDSSIPQDSITDDFSLPRVSHCSVEVDICVQDIVNRKMVKERRLHHDFVESFDPLPNDAKLVYSMAGLWKDETKRRKSRMPNAPPGSSPFPAEVLVSMSADPRDAKDQHWLHEEEYREEVAKLIAREKPAEDATNPSFSDFVQADTQGAYINTTLQSVEDLFPANLLPALGLSPGTTSPDLNPASSIDVDEQKILEQHESALDLFPDDSDEEVLLGLKTPLDLVVKNKPQSVDDGTEILPRPRTAPAVIRQVSDQQSRPGSASSSENRTKTINGLASHPALSMVEGVSGSILTAGKAPVIPVRDEFLAAAETGGLYTRNRALNDPRRTKRHLASLKRSASAPLASLTAKRLKSVCSSQLLSGTSATHAAQCINVTSSIEKQLGKDTGSTRHRFKPEKRAKTRASSQPNQILNFPIVKSQESAANKFRLSQKESSLAKPVSSQEQCKKLVSFDPAVAMIDGKTLSTTTLKGNSDATTRSSVSTESKLARIQSALGQLSIQQQYLLSSLPPSAKELRGTMSALQTPDVIYQDAYYSKDKDVPPRPREYAGKEFRLTSNEIPYLPDFDPMGTSAASKGHEDDDYTDLPPLSGSYNESRALCSFRTWEVARPPPSLAEIKVWWRRKQEQQRREQQQERHPAVAKSYQIRSPMQQRYFSQIDGPTPKNKHGFKYSQRKKSTSVKHEAQYMSTLSLEVHVNTRGKFLPNPDEDEVQCIFWAIKADGTISVSQDASRGMIQGAIVLSPDGVLADIIRRQTPAEVVSESEELDLFVRMVEIVRTHDPDILTGYEVHGSSWGYLIERARTKYDYDLCDEFSRTRSNSHGRIGKENDKWGFDTTSSIRVTGRHMINVWRSMRGELNLLQYTMENVAWHLLHRRIPHYSWRTLTDWYKNGRQRDLNKLLRYYLTRTELNIEILEANELIPRTSEQARLLGVDFFSVFSRGSQFKVESIMFRIAKPENYLLVSPNRRQVGGQNALECLPLVMEPQSAFYPSPLLVLDFQSLYPSVMIAYNLCYSTFLGRIVSWRGMNKMGFTEYKRHKRLLELLKDHINITPNGMMYCKAEIRKSLLAKMLTEILETRVMVKSGMKQDKDDKTLQQLLNNRQLALKLLANVTYGYTSASFSGRMPCAEIADSIVQTGRETLERAIAYIHSQERWGAEVVYGDTDSLFVYLKGRTREQAFDIGNEMAKAITDMNPRPVKLKFEKVYHPCVLLAKKRYVGYKYESRDQVKPDFDAKGIETVRRDGTPAEQKIEEKALKLLFETADLSQVKDYFQSQCEKIMRNTVSVQDFCFAKEVKLGHYSDKGPPPPGALISTKRMLADARAEPQYGERVPYVVITGAPGARLIDRCVAPEELLKSPHAQLDAEYYISKNLIPPLERIFNLVGANVRQWYDEMPKVQRIRRLEQASLLDADGHNQQNDKGSKRCFDTKDKRPAAATAGGQISNFTSKKTLESYMKAASCVVCSVKMRIDGILCARCKDDAPSSLLELQTRLNKEERKYAEVLSFCRSCAALPPMDEVPCDSKDCPVYYTRVKQRTRLGAEKSVLGPIIEELGAGAARAALEW